MPSKLLITIGLTIGSVVGGYVPVLFGAGVFSITSLVGSTVGALVGIYVVYKLS